VEKLNKGNNYAGYSIREFAPAMLPFLYSTDFMKFFTRTKSAVDEADVDDISTFAKFQLFFVKIEWNF